MKSSKVLLILFSVLCLQAMGYCNASDKPNLSEKIYWGGSSPNAVAAQANRMNSLNSSPNSSNAEQSIINPLAGFGSMMQMMNTSSYSGLEQQKQQTDYVKQQVSN